MPGNLFKVICISIIFFISAVCYSQQLSGKVISSLTGEGLDNVFIELNGKTAVISGSDGSFELKIIEGVKSTLVFKRLGYVKKSITVKNTDIPIIVNLEEEILGTDEISVNSSLLEKGDILNSFYINSGLNSIDELISKTQGLTVVKRGNYASEPVLRGLNSDRLSITLNGMKIQSACTDKMDPITSYAETGNLESIEISRGSYSCGKCNTKQAGIDLKLKDAVTSNKFKLTGSVSAGYTSSASGKNLEARLNAGFKKYASNYNFIYRSNKDYRTGTGETVKFSGFNKINFSSSHIFKPVKNFTVSAEVLYDYAWDIGYPALTMDVKSAEALVTGIKFAAKNPLKNIYNTELKLYYNFVNHIMDDSHRNNRIKMDMPGWTTTKGAYFLTGFIASGLTADLKADASITTAKADMTMYVPGSVPMYMLTWPDVKKTDYSVSLNLKHPVSKSLLLQGGAGVSFLNSVILNEIGYGELSVFYPDFSGKDNRTSGSVSGGIKVLLSDELYSGVNYSYLGRDLSISEQYAFYIFNRQEAYDYIGNPFLKTEKVHQLELNAGYSGSRISSSLAVYYNNYSDYIIGIIDTTLSPMTEGSVGVKIYTNIPGAEIMGLEWVAEASVTDEITIVNSLQYIRGKDSYGNELPQLQPLSGTLSARYSAENYGIQAEVQWAVKKEPASFYGESFTPSFSVFNLRGSIYPYEFLTVSLGIENIMDAAYYEHLDWQKIYRPGRNFYMNLKTIF